MIDISREKVSDITVNTCLEKDRGIQLRRLDVLVITYTILFLLIKCQILHCVCVFKI